MRYFGEYLHAFKRCKNQLFDVEDEMDLDTTSVSANGLVIVKTEGDRERREGPGLRMES